MPIYEYECLTCGVVFDKRQSFNDEPKANCPNGHVETRRLLAAPAIVFKGSGFYINDSKATKSNINGSSSKGDKADGNLETKSDSSSEKKSDNSSETKADSSSETKSNSKTETKPESSPAKTEA